MPFCPACRSEFRPGFSRCEECDVELVPVQPPEPPRPAFVALTPVFQSTNYPDTLMVASVLNENGFRAVIENENTAQWLFGMPTPAIPLLVQVPREDASAAREILRERVVDPVIAAVPTRQRRGWLLALALSVPALAGGAMYLGPSQPFAAAGAWAALSLGLILDLRDRAALPSMSEPKIGVFFLLGSLAAGALVLAHDALSGLEAHFAGVVEEPAKLIPVLAAMSLLDRRRPLSWVLACAASGAGFGMVENLLKFKMYPYADSALVITVSGLLHAALTGMIGYLIAAHGWKGGLAGLLVAATLHGGWNALVGVDGAWINLILVAVTVWVYLANANAIARIQHSEVAENRNS